MAGRSGNSPDGTTDSYGSTAMSACNQGESGPLLWIYRRDATTPPRPWLYQGSTCQPNQVPFATENPTTRRGQPGQLTHVIPLTWPATPSSYPTRRDRGLA